jgi:Tol biopolymer transport system component/C-terminal processing protease CtpA/Prc
MLSLFIVVLSSLSFAQSNPNWYRYAAISPDGTKIAFTFKGDLYFVPTTGGVAQPLTFHEAHDFMPVWSNDGTKIAFASDRFGNFDVFVVDVLGGEPTRLTYYSNPEYPYSFSADDKFVILGGQRLDATSHRQYPTASQPELYQVAVTGSKVQQVWTVPAEDIKVSKNGQLMIYHDKKGGENPWRKHHLSAIARDIWIFDKNTGKHTMLTAFQGEDRNPVFSTDEKSIYYLSEESGTFNVHLLNIQNPQQKQQITSFKSHPVRFLSIAKDGTLCFTYNGEIYTLKAGGQPAKINIAIRTEGKKNNQQIIAINGNVSEMAISPNGKEIAYIVRGEVFASSVEGGMTKRITNTPEQERYVNFSPDGNAIMYASERNGLWSIYETQKIKAEEPYFYASTLLKEEALIKNQNENDQPKYSPDGKEIAFIENRRSLKIFNIASKQSRTLLTPNELFYMSDGDQYFSWSPDGKWLLAEYSPVMANTEIVLIPSDGKGKMVNLTESGYTDGNPKWINDGKQMLWFSNRDGLRSYANSGARQADVYSLFFTQDSWDRFRLSKDDYALLKEIEEKNKKSSKDSKESTDKKTNEAKKDSLLSLQLDGIKDRKARLTIHSSALSDAILSKDGETLYYLARFERGFNLWSTKLRTRETKMEIELGANFGRLYWDKEMKNIFLLADGNVSKINPESKKRESVSIRGELNLNITAERQYMFDHVWTRTKAMFYISNFHGANWDELKKVYEPKLPAIGTGYEFAELLSEMLGELNVSHSGATYRAFSPQEDNTASLGILIDYQYTGDGIKITEILKGSPLDKENIKVSSGMIIEQIDGEAITENIDYAALLNRKTGSFVALQIYNPENKSRQQITVKPISIAEENALLYKRWVRKNQEEVEKLSNGQLGYIHVPNMADAPYRNVYEEVMGKFHDKKGIIIDTRFNGGGDLVSDLAMFFTGKKFLDYAIENRSVGYEPTFRWTKPSVAMVNEANYSDGHCFACGYQDLNIGKMIGMPVPGTCSFASWELLQDGFTRWGAVPVSAKNSKGQWLENNQTVPEFQIKNEPDIISKGKDQQLEKAIEELLKIVK